VKVETGEQSVEEPNNKFRYDQHPKTSVKMEELQELHKKVFGKQRGQVTCGFHTSRVQSWNELMEVPLDESLILTEETRQLHGTLEFAADVHREMRQPILESLGVTDEEKTHRDAREEIQKQM
jgi:hypothetical protein